MKNLPPSTLTNADGTPYAAGQDEQSEEEFERALQKYELACREYKLAQTRYIEAIGLFAAQQKFNEAANRICRIDSPEAIVVVMSQEEVNRRAALAVPVVDANK